jgi:hypothetical protein
MSGRLAVVSSVGGLTAGPGIASYSTAKAGLLGPDALAGGRLRAARSPGQRDLPGLADGGQTAVNVGTVALVQS